MAYYDPDNNKFVQKVNNIDETITGRKTFIEPIEIPLAISDNDAVNKLFLENRINILLQDNSIVVPNNDLYVSTTGSDTNNGLTSSKAVKTISKAIELSRNYSSQGFINIHVANGTFTEDIITNNSNVQFTFGTNVTIKNIKLNNSQIAISGKVTAENVELQGSILTSDSTLNCLNMNLTCSEIICKSGRIDAQNIELVLSKFYSKSLVNCQDLLIHQSSNYLSQNSVNTENIKVVNSSSFVSFSDVNCTHELTAYNGSSVYSDSNRITLSNLGIQDNSSIVFKNAELLINSNSGSLISMENNSSFRMYGNNSSIILSGLGIERVISCNIHSSFQISEGSITMNGEILEGNVDSLAVINCTNTSSVIFGKDVEINGSFTGKKFNLNNLSLLVIKDESKLPGNIQGSLYNNSVFSNIGGDVTIDESESIVYNEESENTSPPEDMDM